MRRFLFALVLLSPAALPAAAAKPKPVIPASEKQLIDKWIVRSVQLDGKPTPAQIGQKTGDIIDIKGKDHQFFLR